MKYNMQSCTKLKSVNRIQVGDLLSSLEAVSLEHVMVLLREDNAVSLGKSLEQGKFNWKMMHVAQNQILYVRDAYII